MESTILSNPFIIALILLPVLLLMAAFLFLVFRKRSMSNIMGSLNMSLFLVMMPKYELRREESGQKEEKILIGQMEQIYVDFLYLKRGNVFKRMFQEPPRIAFEIASRVGGTDILFYVAVPKSIDTAFEKYVQGVYPGAVIEKVPEDYTIFEPNGYTAGSFLRLRETPFLPINTYKNLEKDPLASVTNALSKILPEEGAAIQMVIRPSFSQKKWKKIGRKLMAKLKEGNKLSDAILLATRSELSEVLSEAFNILLGLTKPKDQQADGYEAMRKREAKVDDITLKAVQEKVQKQVFEANIRIVASAQNQARADEILGHLEGMFSQFSLSNMNSFDMVGVEKKRLQRLTYDFCFRNFNVNQKNILNIEELTSIYHFPTFHIGTPQIKSVKSVEAPPPEGLSEGNSLNLVGKIIFRGEEKAVSFMSREDRRRHFYVIGQTGVGKTSLLKEMIRQDIENGEGVGVIDPHGELVEEILAHIPQSRVEDVVLFEPFDTERPVGLNMLEYDTPSQKDFAVQEMIAIFHKLFPPEIIGPMFEHYMRNAMLVVMADRENPGTLVEIPRLFTDAEFVQDRLRKVTDPMVRNFWLKEWQQTTGSTRSDMLGYVVSKVGRFIENEMMRNIIGQSYSGFDLGKIMDEKKIFLANLSKGLTGEVNSELLGLILVSKMQMAAMRRAAISEEERKDFYLYIDEFQNFTTDSITTILSEARKYKLNLIMAHQYIPQLTQDIRNAVLGNVGTVGSFRIGADDAEFLEKQFAPEFSKFDLLNLDNFYFILKMMINNKISPAFKVKAIKPKKGNINIVDPIRKISRLKYGKKREIVEAEIENRSKLSQL